jgi:predicted membrane channel-forming protein YqfA (hemolysin III family)
MASATKSCTGVGFHEVFHVFVLAGSLTHLVFMMRHVLPGA